MADGHLDLGVVKDILSELKEAAQFDATTTNPLHDDGETELEHPGAAATTDEQPLAASTLLGSVAAEPVDVSHNGPDAAVESARSARRAPRRAEG